LNRGGNAVTFSSNGTQNGLDEPKVGKRHSRSCRGIPGPNARNASRVLREPLDLAVIQWTRVERIALHEV
jgi:hypothetical protein